VERQSTKRKRHHGHGDRFGTHQKTYRTYQALTLHIIKNRGGEKGKLAFDFVPAFSKFVEVAPS